MKKGVVPRSGIDTDARWGFSHSKGWIFGYKLHMISGERRKGEPQENVFIIYPCIIFYIVVTNVSSPKVNVLEYYQNK